jgi:hypothetical protein
MSDWSSLMNPPPEGHTFVIVSYRHLSPQFQFFLSAVTLGIYFGGYSISAAHKVHTQRNSSPCMLAQLKIGNESF